ncbi:MAG: hypothetical protein ACQKBT_11515 [Puniceicoccales bacterium]
MNTSRYSALQINRARERAQSKEWAGVCGDLLQEAESFDPGDHSPPAFDASWYRPELPYTETYKQFHHYIDGVRPFHAEMSRQLLSGLVFDEDLWRRQVVELVMQWAERIDFQVTHYDSGMEYAYVARLLCDCILGAGDLMSDEEMGRAHVRLRSVADAIVRCSEIWRTELSRMPFNNHRTSHMASFLAMGYVLEDSTLVDPVFDPLDDRSFLHYLDGAIYDDGLCYESSSLYHYATVGGLCTTAMVQRSLFPGREDLFSAQGSYGRNLCDYIKGPLAICFRNQERPRLGDCYGREMRIHETNVFAAAYDATGDPDLLGILAEGETSGIQALLLAPDRIGESAIPDATSRIFPEHGYALLRDDAVVHKQAFLSGDRSGIHHQRDGLQLQVELGDSIVLYCTDIMPSSKHGFSDSIHEEFNRWPHAHSQLQIDELDQKTYSSPIPIREWNADAGSIQRMAMVDEHQVLQDGVHQGRFVSMQNDWVCDCVIADSSTERNWRLFYHLPAGEALDDSFAPERGVQPPDANPWRFIHVEAGTDLTETHRWTSGSCKFQLRTAAPSTVQKFKIPRTDTEKMPGLFALQNGRQAVFITLMTPGDSVCRIEDLRLLDAGEELMARWSVVTAESVVRLQSRILKVRL